jgi:hypothetical protein
MATLSTIHPTLLDFAKRMDPNGNIDKIVEILVQTNPVLEDMVFVEANEVTGHRTTIRTGLPTPTWRKLYGGVQPTKSTTVQVTDSIGMLETYAEVDKALADLNGNSAAWRMSEERAFIEGMNQEMASTLFYGNEATAPEEFTGLQARFDSASAANGENVISGGGVTGGDGTSIWLICWGENTVHGLFPKGSQAGLKMTDKGQVTIESIDGAGGRMEAYRTHYRWDFGLSVRDWRYVVRIGGIDTSTLTKDAATGPDLTDLMAQAIELLPSVSMGRPVFYANRTVRSYLRRQIENKTKNSTLTMDQVGGKRVMAFDDIPVKRCDAILNTESSVGA